MMKEAQQGNAEAQYCLANAYVIGNGVEKSLKDAFKWLKKAAEQGHTEARYAAIVLLLQKREKDGRARRIQEKQARDRKGGKLFKFCAFFFFLHISRQRESMRVLWGTW